MKNNKIRQTSVKWLIDNIPMRYKNALINDCKEEIERAEQIEKTNILHALMVGNVFGTGEGAYEIAEQHYNEIYGKEN